MSSIDFCLIDNCFLPKSASPASQILKRPEGYYVVFKEGKVFEGPYLSRDAAQARLLQLRSF